MRSACMRSPPGAHLPRSPAQEDGGFHVVVRATMAAWAVAEAGAPAEVWLDIRSTRGSDELQYDVIWVNKTATRLPEARRHTTPEFLNPKRDTLETLTPIT